MPARVRAAAAEGRPVFALDAAVPWLTSQGLVFEPTGLSRRPFERWMADQPRGTTVLMASAGRLLPFEWLPTSARNRRGRPGNFGAVSWTIRAARREHRAERRCDVSIRQELGGRPLADLARTTSGPLIMWGDDVLAAIDRGLVVVVINPSGRIVGRWHIRAGRGPWRADHRRPRSCFAAKCHARRCAPRSAWTSRRSSPMAAGTRRWMGAARPRSSLEGVAPADVNGVTG